MDQRVQQVIILMENSFGRQVSVTDLAKAVNLSPWRLGHIFKSETGMPPVQYLRVLRLEHAKRLLETTFLSVKQVMTEVGVKDESHFVRDFKASYGISPARFRQSLPRIQSKDDL